MNIVEYFSEVALEDFSDLAAVRDYFILEEFQQYVGSSDLDFGIALNNFNGMDVPNRLAPDIPNFLKGLPSNYGSNHGTYATRIKSCRKVFMSINKLNIDPDSNEVMLLGTPANVKEHLVAKAKLLNAISSYVNNKVLTKDGRDSLESYLRSADKDFDFCGIQLSISKELLVLLLLTTVLFTEKKGRRDFTECQLDLLKHHLKVYRGTESVIVPETILYDTRDIGTHKERYKRALYGSSTQELLPLEIIYDNLACALEEKNTVRIYNLCRLVGCYRAYALTQLMALSRDKVLST